MTEKQKQVCYYRIQGYSNRHIALIVQVTDQYVGRILSGVDELDLSNFIPPVECVVRRRVLDHIIETAPYVYVPRTSRYGFLSLLGYLGFDYKTLRDICPDEQPQMIYMAIHRSNKAWKEFDSTIIGVEPKDYDDLLRIRRKEKKRWNNSNKQ